MRVPKWLKKALGERGHWLRPYEEWGLRRGFAESMRWWADLIAEEDSFAHAGSSFANRVGVGRVDYYDGPNPPRQEKLGRRCPTDRGVPLWYRRSDYQEKGWEER